MKHYLKLVNFELSRFIKIYLVLILITIVSQLTGTFIQANDYLNQVQQVLAVDSLTPEQFIEENGYLDMLDITFSLWIAGPIALCITVLILYSFFIWYRDWNGKNTFIYRLLMLPTQRITIYFAKVTTILLMVLGLIALQLLLLPVESMMLKWMVPLDFRIDMTVGQIISDTRYMNILIPDTFFGFIIAYGIGFMAVLILFTVILFERSYRWKGIIFGIIYSIGAFILFLSPFLFEAFFQVYFFYPIELLVIEIILWMLVSGISIWVGNYLLNKKVSV